MTYFIYENWRAKGHRAMVHRSDCRFCNNGSGLSGGTRADNGVWHGPFASIENAESFIRELNCRLEFCSHCIKDN